MPRLPKDQVPEIKLDGFGGAIEESLTRDQRRELFENPDSTVMAIVELTAKQYTGSATSEDKAPSVKVRVTFAEAARGADMENVLRDVQRRMYQARTADGTLDETDPRDPEYALRAGAGVYLGEDED
ncbi:hypothetical protein ACF068_14685 [Streptomyces sp. NPDC016309]|uniref:hypothetical protein n=1 Tax=Streptomyces sp. NPDC016309 TaxID=3364965 RepID=UPI0036FD5163